jgi:starch synthase (maltosyl-transferring)
MRGIPSHSLERVVIENVGPVLDAGRHPVKRLLGDSLRVGADVFKDGHDQLRAQLCVRGPGDSDWRTVALAYEYDADRWFASIPLDRIGRWLFTVEAWPDPWSTWRAELRKRVEARQDVRSELLEGAGLLRRAAKSADAGAARALDAAAAILGDATRSAEERISFALAKASADRVAEPLDPAERTRHAPELCVVVDPPAAGFSTWYELFPRSQSGTEGRHGTFADAARRLPELAELGFDVVYLPPIHPIGQTHRKGPNNQPSARPGDPGSPWAIGSEEGGHTAVHPELGTLADFEAFVASARKHGLEVSLDYALQCSPDHPWVREHPDWFHVRLDGTIRYAENPPKKYQDIYPLDFWCADRAGLWNACRDVLRFWIERGVRIFRVDNPHTKPFAFWEWIIDEIRGLHPDVIFLAEAFTRPNRMKQLAKLGFNQSYTYFTWKNESSELREYLEELTGAEMAEYYRPNFFANTPDILHAFLQQGGRPAFRIRLLLAATLSPVYGIYSGFELCENEALRPGSEEYLHSEKYEIRTRDWDAPGNVKDDIRLINRLRREHPALQRLANLRFLPTENERILWYWKASPADDLLIAVNLDPHGPQASTVTVPLDELGIDPATPFEVEDLLDGTRYVWNGPQNYVRLEPTERVAHVFRLRSRPEPAP